MIYLYVMGVINQQTSLGGATLKGCYKNPGSWWARQWLWHKASSTWPVKSWVACLGLKTWSCLIHFEYGKKRHDWIPVVPARGGAEVALGIYYKTFFIYRICMRRAPARPVRACFVRSCCTDVVQEHDLHTTTAQCNAKQTLSSHFTLHSSHFTLALHTPHFMSSHLISSHLISSHLISSHLSSSHLISPHLSSSHLISPHLSSSHLIPSLLTCHLSKFFSAVFTSSEHWSTYLHDRQLLLSERSLLHKKSLGAESFCVQKLETQMHLPRKVFSKYSVLQSLHKALPSTTLY